MDKKQLVDLIKAKIEEGVVTRDEVVSMLDVSQNLEDSPEHESSSKISMTLYAIGFAAIVVGIGIVTSNNWEVLGVVGRIAITLGIGVATFISGYMYTKQNYSILAQVLYLLSAGLVPFGLFVTLNELNYDSGLITVAAIFAALAVAYGFVHSDEKSPITLLTSIVFGSTAYYALVSKILDGTDMEASGMKIAVILAGIAYATLGYAYKVNKKFGAGTIRGIILSAAVASVLIPLFTYEASFVDGILFIAALGAMYFTVFARSGIALTAASIGLVAAIVKVVGEYFFDTFGIAMALVALGFVVMGIGYATVALYKQRISRA